MPSWGLDRATENWDGIFERVCVTSAAEATTLWHSGEALLVEMNISLHTMNKIHTKYTVVLAAIIRKVLKNILDFFFNTLNLMFTNLCTFYKREYLTTLDVIPTYMLKLTNNLSCVFSSSLRYARIFSSNI